MDKPALDELAALLNRVLPIRTHDTAAYDELYFGEHQTQAMTMDPATWNSIGEGLPALIALARQSVERGARVVELEAALSAHNIKCANGETMTLADELETAAGTLDCFRDADKEAGLDGLRDCTDDDGNAYQSEHMAGLMDHALYSSQQLRKWAATLRAALTGAA